MTNWSSVFIHFYHCYYFVLKHYSNLSVQNCTKNFLRPSINPKIRVKHGFHPDQNILIVDDKHLLTFIQIDDVRKMKSKADSAFFTTSHTFITQQGKIFNYFWENALDIKTRLAEVKLGEEYQIQPLIGERNLIKKMSEFLKNAESEVLAFFSIKLSPIICDIY